MHLRIVSSMGVVLLGVCAATAAAGVHREGDATLERLRVIAAPDGTLTLIGQANSRAAAERTIEIARDSDGVKRVESRLTIAHHAHR